MLDIYGKPVIITIATEIKPQNIENTIRIPPVWRENTVPKGTVNQTGGW